MARTPPSLAYQYSGHLVTSTLWNEQVKTLNDYLANRPTFRGLQGVAVSVANATWTAIQMDTSVIDTDGGHNTGINNTRYTCQVAGWYWVKGCIAWNGSGSVPLTRADSVLAVNGGTIQGSATFLHWGTNQSGSFSVTAMVFLNVGDYVEVWGRQGTGTSRFFDNNSTGGQCDMSLWWLSN